MKMDIFTLRTVERRVYVDPMKRKNACSVVDLKEKCKILELRVNDLTCLNPHLVALLWCWKYVVL